MVLGIRCKPGFPADTQGSTHSKAFGPCPDYALLFVPWQDSTAWKQSDSGQEQGRDLSKLSGVKKTNRKKFSENKD